MGGFTLEASPLVTSYSEDEDADDGDDDDASDGDDDGDASSTNKMSTGHSYPLSLVTKRESSFGYERSHS